MRKAGIGIICAVWICGAALGGCAGGSGQAGSQEAGIQNAEIQSALAGAETEDGEGGGAAAEVRESSGAAGAEPAVPALEDGIYTAEFDTDSSMFHVSEACDGKGTLTVQDGAMTIHISLGSKNIVNLYPGLAEDARKEGAELLEPTVDSVTYSDGFTEEVYGFDVPVPVLDEEFDLALIGKKGKWYDHKVRVSDPVRVEDGAASPVGATPQAGAMSQAGTGTLAELEDGEYLAEVVLEGGTGRAGVDSPARIVVEDGKARAQIVWSSPNYDYMKLGEETYLPVNTEGNSEFEIPVEAFDVPIPVTADTVAMGTPHEIEYTIRFDGASVEQVKE
ncbi:MAG TPA: hypothetical protein IAC37_08805 [Candidatus Ventrimonas merdavium]|nr:hypothetical protein [Candidatus Ventrimonas merdavium]